MHITGKLFEINPSQQISESFKKRTFVLEYVENPQYPEYISFELIQDRCDLLDVFSDKEEITVYFNLRGRKWTNPEGVVKYFNTLQAWRLEKGNKENESTRLISSSGDIEDDLPF